MFPTTTLAAAVVMMAASTTTAHMVMSFPPPVYAQNNPNSAGRVLDTYTAPLSGRSQYPCRDPSVVAALGTPAGKSVAAWKAGSQHNMTVTGGAFHGGGSCQLALSYDKGASFKVIKSFIGACPSGNGDSKYDFTVPADAPAGEALFAWTWFNKIGNREMYMNCAVVTIEGGSSGAAASGVTFAQRPNIFVANIDGSSGCRTKESIDPDFPNPGDDVTRAGSVVPGLYVDPAACKDAGNTGAGTPGGAPPPPGGGGGSGSSSSSAATSSRAAAPTSLSASVYVIPSAAATLSSSSILPTSVLETTRPTPMQGGGGPITAIVPVEPRTSETLSSPSSSSLLLPPSSSSPFIDLPSFSSTSYSPGGGFVTSPPAVSASSSKSLSVSVPVSVSVPTTSLAVTAKPTTTNRSGSSTKTTAAPTSAATTSKTVPSGPLTPTPIKPTLTSTSGGVKPPLGTGTPGVPGQGNMGPVGGFPMGTRCSEEGTWNCVDGKSFQRCASGAWSVVQPVAPGTSCKPGISPMMLLARQDGSTAVSHGLRHGRRHHPRALLAQAP